jgi:hypothetical protein
VHSGLLVARPEKWTPSPPLLLSDPATFRKMASGGEPEGKESREGEGRDERGKEGEERKEGSGRERG